MSRAGKAYAKITPFKYPTKRHKRTEAPPAFSNYRLYKPSLKIEFGGRCVYCRKSDVDQDPSAFHVEHYRPKKDFPYLETMYSNLFYSCAACNRWKKRYWSEEAGKRVLNPCDHVMSHHLKFVSQEVGSHTEQGQLNIDVLRLNNAEALAYRKSQQESLLLLLQGVTLFKGTKKPEELRWIDNAVGKIAELTQKTNGDIRSVCGV